MTAPTVPFSRLPEEIFRRSWSMLAAGRWQPADHITLGETWVHVKLWQSLASRGDTHRHRVLSLEDNSATAASVTKGRSSAPALNYLLRQNAGIWRIFDVYLDGSISELATRRSEYTSILDDQGFDGLIDRLEERIARHALRGGQVLLTSHQPLNLDGVSIERLEL